MLPPAHKAIEAAAFDRLVSRGLLAREDFDAALKESFSGKKELESILLTKYRLSKAQLGQALSEFFDCPYVPYDDRTVVDVELVKNLSFDYLRRNFWIPLRRQPTAWGPPTSTSNRILIARRRPSGTGWMGPASPI